MSRRETTAWPSGAALSYCLILAVAIASVGANALGADAWLVRVAVGIVIVAAMAGGVVRNRPAPISAWMLMTLAVTMWVAGDTLWDWLTSRGIDTPANTHWADAVYLAGYVLIGVGQVLLGRARGRQHLADGMIDGSVLALAAVIVVWVTLVAPQQYAGMTFLDRAILAGYPLCDGLLLAGIAWLAFTPARRGPSMVLLGSAMATILAADLLWNLGARFGESWEVWINPLYPIAYATLAAAAIHPSVRRLTEPAPSQDQSVHVGRLVFLSAAMFAGPLAVMVADNEFSASDVMLTFCSLVVVALVIVRFVGLVRDNERAQQRFRLLAENVPVGIYEVSDDLEISFANTEADRLFGRSIEQKRAGDLLALVDPADRGRMIQAADTVLGGRPADVAFRLRDPGGAVRWVQWRGTPVASQRRGLPTALASTLDITDLKEAQAALQRQATHDPLTQLPNRRLLSDRLIQAFARRDRRPGTLALMFCDLDGFKTVNDVHGHDAGDGMLVEISRRLCLSVRATDSVARIGGDEFVVLCEDAGSRDDLAHLADKLVTAVNQPWRCDEMSLTVGVSVGIAIAGFDDDASSLLRRADDAMYRAKAGGRNRFEFAPDDTSLPEVAGFHHVGEADR